MKHYQSFDFQPGDRLNVCAFAESVTLGMFDKDDKRTASFHLIPENIDTLLEAVRELRKIKRNQKFKQAERDREWDGAEEEEVPVD